MKYINRIIENKIKRYLKQFPAVILTGPRQSGKSTTLKEIFCPKYKYITLEDPSIRESIMSEPELFLEMQPKYLIFDEIQYFPEILIHLKILIDKSREEKGRFILTGSQQFKMMKNVSETLAGRIGILHLLPLSFEEKQIKSNSLKSFSKNCIKGSYPELFTHPKYNIQAWYDSYIQTYLERDIKSIYNIGNLRNFTRFMILLASRCAQQLNLSQIANDIGTAVNTIKNWVSLLEASYIIYLLPPYYQNIGKQISKSPKIYFTDSGLVCHLLNIRREEDLINHPLIGSFFENYCIQEHLKHFENIGIRPELYYIRTKTGKEIDLLIRKGNRFMPIEIKLTKSPNKRMTEPMEFFYYQVKGIKLEKGIILSLINEKLPLTKNVIAYNFNEYFSYLKKHVTSHSNNII